MMEKHTTQGIDFKRLFENIPGLYMILDTSLNIVACTDAYTLATKTVRNEILGRNVFDVFPDNPNQGGTNNANSLRGSLQYVLDTKTPNPMAVLKYDIPLPEKEGGGFEERYWSIINTPVFNDNGDLIYIMNAVEDITEFMRLKQKGSELTAKATKMENEVFMRAEQVQEINKKLLAAETLLMKKNDELAQTNAELESFSYSVSHDLRAPLRAISGYAQIINEDYRKNLDDAGRQMLESITLNSNRMGQLIDDLLTFSRLGRRESIIRDINMDLLANKVVGDQKKNAKGLKANITIRPLPPATGDISLVEQVFINLISNAIKYSSKTEKPEIEIGWLEKDKQKVYYVKDNGVGFDMAYYDKLFGVFSRLHAINEFEGTGVGLALTKRIVSRHGGKVWAMAELGKGATFYFTLGS